MIGRVEFLLRAHNGAEVWTQLQGAGGQLGDGCRPALAGHRREQALAELLGRARAELRATGKVRIWRGADLAPSERIVAVPVASIEAAEVAA